MVETQSHAEEVVSEVEVAAGDAVRGVELAVIALLALLVSPPLLILLVIVVVPTVALGLVAAVFALPVIVARHLHGRRLEQKR
ncbi:hypothetical protein [Solirubrobacter deserti]|uniref:Uncharacterized protein n=1 Tax=Solirubrobacter deserti TaxID=2282478 RepID=A0ABT4RPA2_9ACTN|nr:hypothetical protein [Solirubrobacter deserti]MDA0140400.1 hypothetical protein [Solirubrobacter deserti]